MKLTAQHLIYIVVIGIVIQSCAGSLRSVGNPYYQESPEPKVSQEYDEFKDHYIYRASPAQIHRKPGHTINMSAFYLCGQENCAPGLVTVRLTSLANNWQYLDYREINIIADERIYSYNPDHTGDVIDSYSVLEQMSIVLEASEYLNIFTSDSIRIRIGNIEPNFKQKPISLRQMAQNIQKSIER